MAGKGSKQRPLSGPRSTFDQNWDAIFGNSNGKIQPGPLHRVELDDATASQAAKYIKTAVFKYNQQSF
jgi:hypothetical protein